MDFRWNCARPLTLIPVRGDERDITGRGRKRASEQGCIDLTDSGLRVKTRGAHMKTQLRKPARSKERYTDQYKQEAVELWRASGRSAAKVAAELGIRPPLLYRWASLARGPSGPKAITGPGCT